MQPVNTASCVYIAYTTACYRTRFTYRPPSLFLETKLVERLCDTKIGGYFRKSVYIASTLGVCVDVMILHVHRYGQPLFVIINEHNWKSTRVRGERIDADFFGTRQGKARQGKAKQSKGKTLPANRHRRSVTSAMPMLRRVYAAGRVYRFRGDVTNRKVLEEPRAAFLERFFSCFMELWKPRHTGTTRFPSDSFDKRRGDSRHRATNRVHGIFYDVNFYDGKSLLPFSNAILMASFKLVNCRVDHLCLTVLTLKLCVTVGVSSVLLRFSFRVSSGKSNNSSKW